MHAEHADRSELNELSGRVIGCAFTAVNTRRESNAMHQLSESDRSAILPAAELRQVAPGDQMFGTWPIDHAESSACFA